MKELWNILMEKLKEVKADYVSLGVGIAGIIMGFFATIIIVKFFTMIIKIIQIFAPHAN